jgi:predicted O-methyltransferase YrrM
LAEGLTGENAKMITIEKNDELEQIIRHNLARSPLGEKVHLMVGDALQILPAMTDVFDLIFMDGDKCEYEAYYHLIFPLLKRGGWLLADNTLWDGHIIDEKYDKDKQTVGLRTFNDMLAKDERVEQLILPLRDGLTIVHKK